MGYNVCVLGVTGAVGQEMIKCLEQRKFPVDNIVPVASPRSEGREILFKGKSYRVNLINKNIFKSVDIILASAGAKISSEWLPLAVSDGAVAVDNSSAFRQNPEIPLVVPEVNPQKIKEHRGIISNPNCVVAGIVLALKAFYDVIPIKRIIISTYQSVSGAGGLAMQELMDNTQAVLTGNSFENKVFSRQIAFNLIPVIPDKSAIDPEGYTNEEKKIMFEIKKILDDFNIGISVTSVRVPVFRGHSASLNIEFVDNPDLTELEKSLNNFSGLKYFPKHKDCPDPLSVANKDDVLVGRLRKDPSNPRAINVWVVSDNLRKGAALNAVQIAELLIDYRLI